MLGLDEIAHGGKIWVLLTLLRGLEVRFITLDLISKHWSELLGLSEVMARLLTSGKVNVLSAQRTHVKK